MLVATTNDLPGYRITAHIGMVRGVTVRSRSIVGNIGGAVQSLVGITEVLAYGAAVKVEKL